MSIKMSEVEPIIDNPENPSEDPNLPPVPEPTLPEPSPEEPNPYPVTDPVSPEPVPEYPPNVIF